MRNIAILFAAAMAAVPVTAQEADMPPPAPPPAPDVPAAMTSEQMMTYESWGVDRQAMYDNWPAEAKAYFWSLPPSRQDLFFRLSDSDRAMMLSMPDAEREAAWDIVESQIQSGVPGGETAPDGGSPMEKAPPPPPGER